MADDKERIRGSWRTAPHVQVRSGLGSSMQNLKYFLDNHVEIPVSQGQLVLGPVSPQEMKRPAVPRGFLVPCLDGPRAFLSVLLSVCLPCTVHIISRGVFIAVNYLLLTVCPSIHLPIQIPCSHGQAWAAHMTGKCFLLSHTPSPNIFFLCFLCPLQNP